MEDKKPTPKDMESALFMNLVMMLASSAAQSLGMKLPGMGDAQSKVNLDAAQMMIDMIEVLRAKTQGNRTPDEDTMMKDVLAQLQFSYVQAAESVKGKPADAPPAESPAPAAAAATEPPASTEPKKPDPEPRFRKSYG